MKRRGFLKLLAGLSSVPVLGGLPTPQPALAKAIESVVETSSPIRSEFAKVLWPGLKEKWEKHYDKETS